MNKGFTFIEVLIIISIITIILVSAFRVYETKTTKHIYYKPIVSYGLCEIKTRGNLWQS